jgi:hypothetical protein
MVSVSHPRIELEILSWSKNEYFRFSVLDIEICTLSEGKEASNRERLNEGGRKRTKKIQCIFLKNYCYSKRRIRWKSRSMILHNTRLT